MRRAAALALLAGLPLAAAPARAGEAAEAAPAEYRELARWSFGPERPVPAGGFAFALDVGSWRLDAGSYRLQEPTSRGLVSGLVFAGSGTYRFAVPDPVELAQLRRFADDPQADELAGRFSELVLRTSDPELLGGLAGAGDGPFEGNGPARERHEHWLRVQRVDADARVVAARLDAQGSGAQPYLRVDVKSDEHGWLTFEYEPRRAEEVSVTRFNARRSFAESWLSLDRAADRDARGRPGRYAGPALDLEHADLSVRLLRLGRNPGLSDTSRHTLTAEIRAAVDLRSRRPAQRALQLYLHPWAEVSAVTDGAGRPLEWMRDPIGRRFSSLERRVQDVSLVVVAPRALDVGDGLRVIVDYELEVVNYVPGRFWYPATEGRDDGISDLHSGTIEVTLRDAYDVRAMGEAQGETVGDGIRVARWRTDRPVKMLTFAFTRKVREETLEAPDAPDVVVFAPPLGADTENRMHDVGADVMNSLRFFQNLLASPVGGERIYATIIQAFHGQAFEGFLHLSEFSVYRERSGPTELFLAHEVAHQWWGHQVGWESYRDQWLSEGLAEYCGLLFLQATHERGDKLFEDAIQAYADEVNGSIKSRMSPFARPGTSLMNKTAARRIGPIGHGWRAATGEAPGAYFSQSYHKAALVLHMLRVLLRYTAAGEEAFVEILRDFVATYRGGNPRTADFVAVVEDHAPGDWGWFFDQWIYSAAVPTWDSQVDLPKRPEADGTYRIALTVRQSGVPDDFRMPVPVRVTFESGAARDYVVAVAGPESRLEIAVPERPKRVVFNPDDAILARTNRR